MRLTQAPLNIGMESNMRDPHLRKAVLAGGIVKDTEFCVQVDGPVTAELIERVIAYLELAKHDYIQTPSESPNKGQTHE